VKNRKNKKEKTETISLKYATIPTII